MSSPTLVALTLVAPDEDDAPPESPIGEGEILIFLAFAVVIGSVFAFDMIRTSWETNRWRREERRRRREQV
jgi:hypothetical protein